MKVKIRKLSFEISKSIHEQLACRDSIEIRHLNHFNNLEDINFNDTVLVLGLNPSSADLDTKNKVNNCFIHYFPEHLINDNNHQIVTEFAQKGFTYNRYFRKIYELFLPYDYYPIWVNVNYLKSKRDYLSDDEYVLLESSIKDTGKYCIYSDLIFYKETTAKKIQEIINSNSDLKNKVLELFTLQIDLFKPKVVLINNAYASKLVLELLINELKLESEIYTHIKFKNSIVIFSALLTSGVTDVFSYERLKNEIKEIMS
jgi:hypothetical protein